MTNETENDNMSRNELVSTLVSIWQTAKTNNETKTQKHIEIILKSLDVDTNTLD